MRLPKTITAHRDVLDGVGMGAIIDIDRLFSMDDAMMIFRLMTAAFALNVACLDVSAYAGNARGHTYTPEAGDTPLQIKCRSEAAAMISGGKGSAQYADYNRQLRKDHIKKCMAGG